MTFKDHFSSRAGDYLQFRPTYPPTLFDYLASLVSVRETAWDVGCGNGQAAVELARHFSRVIATDASAQQIGNAVPHPRVEYRVAPAEDPGIAEGSVDLVTIAQALHWFDFDRFYREVRRVARPGAVIAAVSYGLLSVAPEVDRILGGFYTDILGSFWPPERKFIDHGYGTIPFPFEEIVPPAFVMEKDWGFDHLTGYLETWSAVKACRKKTGKDPLDLVLKDLRSAWGEAGASRHIVWPLVLRVGRINPE
jgi:SAM-dependent methyltransferase